MTGHSAREWEKLIQEHLHEDVLCGALEEFVINENDNTLLITGWISIDNLRWIATVLTPSTGMYKEKEDGTTSDSADEAVSGND